MFYKLVILGTEETALLPGLTLQLAALPLSWIKEQEGNKQDGFALQQMHEGSITVPTYGHFLVIRYEVFHLDSLSCCSTLCL